MNEQHNAVVKYISKLRKALRHLSPEDCDDITREIKGHVIERWEVDSKGSFDDMSLDGVLKRMGSPELIASQYCDQRGWAKPPKKHTLRNVLLTVTALFLLVVFGIGYFSYKFVFSPVAGFVSGKSKIVEIGDDGIKIMNGAISIGDDGVKIGGAISIGGDGEENDDAAGFSDIKSWQLQSEENGELDISAVGMEGFELNNRNGNINVTGADIANVKISYTKKVYGDDSAAAQDFIKQIKLEQTTESGKIVVKSAYPDKPARVKGHSIDFDVKVPRNMALYLDFKNGKADIKDIGKGVSVTSKNGSVTADKITGNFNVSMKNGPLKLNNVGGDVAVEMKNGQVVINDIGGKVAVANKNGHVKLKNVNGDLQAETEHGHIQADNIGGNIKAEAKMGMIEIVFGDNYGFTLSGQTKLGAVDCDFPTARTDGTVTGKVGDGKHTMELSTKMGAIKVKRQS
jgi:uncharacterized membrane protein